MVVLVHAVGPAQIRTSSSYPLAMMEARITKVAELLHEAAETHHIRERATAILSAARPRTCPGLSGCSTTSPVTASSSSDTLPVSVAS